MYLQVGYKRLIYLLIKNNLPTTSTGILRVVSRGEKVQTNLSMLRERKYEDDLFNIHRGVRQRVLTFSFTRYEHYEWQTH